MRTARAKSSYAVSWHVYGQVMPDTINGLATAHVARVWRSLMLPAYAGLGNAAWSDWYYWADGESVVPHGTRGVQ